jgi:hypothetical protein
MRRRRFDHLFAEASVAADRLLPRFELWMEFHEAGLDPEALSRAAVVDCGRARLPGFLATRGLGIAPRAARRLEREVARFDPRHPTPYERFAALS